MGHKLTRSLPLLPERLSFENGKWRVNENWDADSRMIKVFFATISQVEPRRPVAAVVTDSIKKELEKNGVHVTMSAGGLKKHPLLLVVIP